MASRILKIFVTKLNESVNVDFFDWTTDAQVNAVEVGLGRILNDATASVLRKDYDSDAEFLKVCKSRVKTRYENLRNGDKRQGADARVAELEKQLAEAHRQIEELTAPKVDAA